MNEIKLIQTFGRYFAGSINLMPHDRYHIKADYAGDPFALKDVSPFSVIGKPDFALQRYVVSEHTNTRVKADLRKNFDQICEQAHCEYFVIDNADAMRGLFEINGQFYTAIWDENTDFMREQFANDMKKVIFPVNVGLSDRLRKQYDRFIDVILQNYDSEKIILIRSYAKRFRFGDGKIVKTQKSGKEQPLLDALDARFIERTGCLVVDAAEPYLEQADNVSGRLSYGTDMSNELALEVISAIENPETYRASALGNDVLSTKTDECKRNRLADYIAGDEINQKDIINILSNGLISSDDVVAICYLFQEKANVPDFSIIFKRLSSTYLRTRALFDKNLQLLNNYEFNTVDLAEARFDEKIFIKLSPQNYAEINPNGVEFFSLTHSNTWDWERFVRNGFACDFEHIYDALESWETYFERGRHQLTSPFVLKFDSKEQIIDALYWFDYSSVFRNENYIIATDAKFELKTTWNPKVDLSFFFDKNVRIVSIRGGLSDNINHYMLKKYICDEYGISKIYIDDMDFLRTERQLVHNHLLFYNVVSETTDMSIFARVSLALKNRWQTARNKHRVHDYWFLASSTYYVLGLKEAVQITARINPNGDRFDRSIQLDYPIFMYKSFEEAKLLYGNARGYVPLIDEPYNCHLPMSFYKQKHLYEKHISFPPFDASDEQNRALEQKMLNSDAVIVHIRRGDYVKLGWVDDQYAMSYYKAQLSKAYSIPDYPNKHLFVFSDDIDWVKENATEIGLTDFAGRNITYINHNFACDAWLDQHLMTLGKLIIVARSSFNNVAALVSKRVEWILGDPSKGGHTFCFYGGRTSWWRGEVNAVEKFKYKKIIIKSVLTGKYLCAQATLPAPIFATASESDALVIDCVPRKADVDQIGLLSLPHNRYLSTEVETNMQPIRVRHTDLSGWENYFLFETPNGQFFIRSVCNGRLFEIRGDNRQLYVNNQWCPKPENLFEIQIVE